MDSGYPGEARRGRKLMHFFKSILATTLLLFTTAWAEPPANTDGDPETNAEPTGDGIDRPKSLSGMSILGNEETPKALVIVPWKSSELGDDISLSDTLDDRARPVDREVFLRELRFYEIRSETSSR